MTEKTVTVGDTEVLVRETEDGFEAVPVPEDVPYIRASSGSYGFEIPVTADFVLEKDDRLSDRGDPAFRAAWHSDDDRGDLKGDGNSRAMRAGYDSYAVVRDPHIVDP